MIVILFFHRFPSQALPIICAPCLIFQTANRFLSCFPQTSMSGSNRDCCYFIFIRPSLLVSSCFSKLEYLSINLNLSCYEHVSGTNLCWSCSSPTHSVRPASPKACCLFCDSRSGIYSSLFDEREIPEVSVLQKQT